MRPVPDPPAPTPPKPENEVVGKVVGGTAVLGTDQTVNRSAVRPDPRFADTMHMVSAAVGWRTSVCLDCIDKPPALFQAIIQNCMVRAPHTGMWVDVLDQLLFPLVTLWLTQEVFTHRVRRRDRHTQSCRPIDDYLQCLMALRVSSSSPPGMRTGE